MQCKKCGRYITQDPCAICSWDEETASSPKSLNFSTVSTVSFKNLKNVPISRVNMVKRRALHPDSPSGDVVLKNHAGKLTNRLASDY